MNSIVCFQKRLNSTNKSLHIQIERKAGRTWQVQSVSSNLKKMRMKMKRSALFFLVIITPLFVYSQECDCYDNYLWMKKTFEENDAGF